MRKRIAFSTVIVFIMAICVLILGTVGMENKNELHWSDMKSGYRIIVIDNNSNEVGNSVVYPVEK